jgi:DNA-binding MarR family transcriptional regulator
VSMESKRVYRDLAEFRYQLRRFLRFSEQAARAADLEPQQHQLLLAIQGLPAGLRPTMAALAERLQINHNSAVELVDRCERRGLVERARDPQDGRKVLLEVTPAGAKLLARLTIKHRQHLRSSGKNLAAVLQTLSGRKA